jgi:hypothetical protein
MEKSFTQDTKVFPSPQFPALQKANDNFIHGKIFYVIVNIHHHFLDYVV